VTIASSSIGGGRDEQRETRILAVIADRATRLVGLPCDSFPRRVALRLRAGQARYGHLGLEGRDLLGEALQEPVDVAGWSLLLLQRDAAHMPREAQDDVLRAIVLAAACDAYLRRAARRTRERTPRPQHRSTRPMTPTQNDRALKMLRSAGRRGITQLDADALPKPIRRLASRINDLRTAGYLIATPGRRHKMVVYVLVAAATRT